PCHRRRQKENRSADQIRLEGTEIGLTTARQVLRRQQAGSQQPAQGVKSLEVRTEVRDLVSQLAEEAARRQLLKINPALAAPRAILIHELTRTVGASPHAALLVVDASSQPRPTSISSATQISADHIRTRAAPEGSMAPDASPAPESPSPH